MMQQGENAHVLPQRCNMCWNVSAGQPCVAFVYVVEGFFTIDLDPPLDHSWWECSRAMPHGEQRCILLFRRFKAKRES